REMAEDFEVRGALLRIDSGEQLHDAVLRAAAEPGLGERARAAADAKRGATANAADVVLRLHDSHYPCERRPQPLQTFLWLLSLLWKAGSARDRRVKLS